MTTRGGEGEPQKAQAHDHPMLRERTGGGAPADPAGAAVRDMPQKEKPPGRAGRLFDVFRAALRLGLTSFGGPAAHIGYFRAEYVTRRRWLDERAFAELTALCQFLPGPASSQLGMAIGMRRAGVPGAVAAWLGFTLPSAAAMLTFALWLGSAGAGAIGGGWLHGLLLVAAAVVAQAVWSLGRTLAPDPPRATMALATAGAAVLIPGPAGQLAPLAACAAAGWLLYRRGRTGGTDGADRAGQAGAQEDAQAAVTDPLPPYPAPVRPPGRRTAAALLAAFALLLALLPLLARLQPESAALSLADSSYRAGSLVFGGGHVVLPLLQAEVVHGGPNGLAADRFMAGYAAAQAVPGPLFTFAAFVGGAAAPGWEGAVLGLVALLFIFIPSFLLLAGVLPFWHSLRERPGVRAAVTGVNAGVVGILLAALYRPIWTETVLTGADFAFALAALLLLQTWRRPPWQVVLAGAAAGWLLWP